MGHRITAVAKREPGRRPGLLLTAYIYQTCAICQAQSRVQAPHSLNTEAKTRPRPLCYAIVEGLWQHRKGQSERSYWRRCLYKKPSMKRTGCLEAMVPAKKSR